MKPLLAMLVVSGLAAAAEKGADEAAKKGLKEMAGTWKVVAEEAEGMKLTAEQVQKMKVKLIMKGDRYTVYFGEDVVAKGKLRLDPTKDPKEVDAIATEGEFKDKPMRGIYTLEKDEMRVCFAKPGDARPKHFRTKKGSGRVLLGYKRVKP